MFKSMIDKASNYTKDAIINNSIENTKKSIISSVAEAHTSVSKYAKETSKGADDIFDKYWPIIEKLLLSSLIGIAEKSLDNDAALEMAFSTTYAILPTPFRLIISRDRFISFCMSKKKTILKSLSKYKEEHKTNKIDIDVNNKLISDNKNNHMSTYENLLPELISFCIIADGVVEDVEIELATAIINNDENIENKNKAIESLSLYIEKNISNKVNSEVLFKLNFSSLIAKISKLENPKEKERIDIIIDGMLNSVKEGSITETKAVVDTIKDNLSVLEPA